MILCAIAAMAKNRVIGINNRLPWDLPGDLKFFRETTLGKAIIMGRKTFESLGRPLPKRRNIVLSRQSGFRPTGAEVFEDLDRALEVIGADVGERDEVFVIGGSEIYAYALPYLDRIYLTEIERDFEGDAKFPDFDRERSWRLVKQRRAEENGVLYRFCIYDRRGSKD